LPFSLEQRALARVSKDEGTQAIDGNQRVHETCRQENSGSA